MRREESWLVGWQLLPRQMRVTYGKKCAPASDRFGGRVADLNPLGIAPQALE
jgi:hypothetical protein